MNVLTVLGDSERAEAVQRFLRPAVDALWSADDLASARKVLASGGVDLVVADGFLADGAATDLLEDPMEPDFPLVVLGLPGPRVGADARSRGAVAWLPWEEGSLRALPHLLHGAMREHGLRDRARVAEERLLHANRLMGVGRLAAVMAHEVGTPLNVARMHAQLLSSSHPDDDSIREACDAMVGQIDVVSRRVRAMLDFARLGERGRGAINLAEAVHSAVGLVEPLARRQRVELRLDGPQLVAVANRSQVQQVVFNLVTNALHALSGPGTVEVVLEATEREGRAFAVVAVIDDGPGVADAVRERLFDAFVTTKPVGGGTGLGLAVCREIAEAHGGWVDLVSEPGRTEVRVAFPA